MGDSKVKIKIISGFRSVFSNDEKRLAIESHLGINLYKGRLGEDEFVGKHVKLVDNWGKAREFLGDDDF